MNTQTQFETLLNTFYTCDQWESLYNFYIKRDEIISQKLTAEFISKTYDCNKDIENRLSSIFNNLEHDFYFDSHTYESLFSLPSNQILSLLDLHKIHINKAYDLTDFLQFSCNLNIEISKYSISLDEDITQDSRNIVQILDQQFKFKHSNNNLLSNVIALLSHNDLFVSECIKSGLSNHINKEIIDKAVKRSPELFF